MRRILATLAIAVVSMLALGALFVFSGRYDVGADQRHWSLTESVLGTLRDRSINAAAEGIQVPKLDDAAMIAKGASSYAEMCAGCHLSPLSRDSDTRRGLYPQPPDFYRQRVEPRRAFWVTKHGLKMSGMPAWGRTHDDGEIWSLVAFLQKLPDLDGEAYRAMAMRAAAQGRGHGHAR